MMRQRAVMVGILVAALCIVNTAPAYGAIGDYQGQWGSFGVGDGQFVNPCDVAVASGGEVYVVDLSNNRIQYFGPTGQYKGQWGSYGVGDGQFRGPRGIAIAPNGDVYVVDTGTYRIQYFTQGGVFKGTWGSQGHLPGQFRYPQGIAVAPNGDVYVADCDNNRIQYFGPEGQYRGQWGTLGTKTGEFHAPCGVDVALDGDVYVADAENHRIQRFSATGDFKGAWGSDGSADGQLRFPVDIAISPNGDAYVADLGNHRVQYFSSAGDFKGMWGSVGKADGQLSGPDGMAIARNGTVYVADSPNRRVQYFAGELPSTEIAGPDRYVTAVEASKAGYPSGAATVVIATGENWPDALGGSALAGAVEGPLLLVRATTIPDSTRAEIIRLKAKTAYVLGGSGAIEDVVVAQLKTMLGAANVIQLEGPTRYETAQEVAAEVVRLRGASFGGLAFIARGDNYPDALAASPLSAAWRAPIILARPGTDAPPIPPEVTAVRILGQTDVVSGAIESALKSALGDYAVARLGGATRYETAAAIATYGTAAGLVWDGVGITTGENFPDALAGGVLQGKQGSVMLLTRTSTLSLGTAAALTANKAAIDRVTFYGSTAAVGPAVRTAVAQLLE